MDVSKSQSKSRSGNRLTLLGLGRAERWSQQFFSNNPKNREKWLPGNDAAASRTPAGSRKAVDGL